MTVECPACNSSFPVDPKKVPAGGVHARCSVCQEVFFVEEPSFEAEPTPVETSTEATVEAVESPDALETFQTLPEEAEEEALPAYETSPEPDMALADEAIVEAPAEMAEDTFNPAQDEFQAEEPAVDLAEEEEETLSEPSQGFDEAAFPTPSFGEAEPVSEEPGTTFEDPALPETDPDPAFQEPTPTFGEGESTFDLEGPDLDTPLGEEAPETALSEPTFVGTEDTASFVTEEAVAPDTDPLMAETPVVEEPTAPSFDEPMAPSDFEAPAVEEMAAEESVTSSFDEPTTPAVETPPPPEPTPATPLPTPQFGRRDPKEKAQRLARVLVSDIILYNPDRHQRALDEGRLKEEFDDEVQKSWSEYVEQVGEEIANSTNFFSEALNEILAKGQKMF